MNARLLGKSGGNCPLIRKNPVDKLFSSDKM